jgi:hypothetical protein
MTCRSITCWACWSSADRHEGGAVPGAITIILLEAASRLGVDRRRSRSDYAASLLPSFVNFRSDPDAVSDFEPRGWRIAGG